MIEIFFSMAKPYKKDWICAMQMDGFLHQLEFCFLHGSCSKNAQEIITASQRGGGNRRNIKKRVTTLTLTGSVKEMI